MYHIYICLSKLVFADREHDYDLIDLSLTCDRDVEVAASLIAANLLVSIETALLESLARVASSCWVMLITF